jgi:c-di-GMP-binding flagellar brake protein YcgR
MFQDTRPAPLGDDAAAFADFRVDNRREQLILLRQLRDGSTPISLSAADGISMTVTLWALDDQRERLNFSADDGNPQLQRLIDSDEAVGVAYLDSVKLQFDLHGLLLVRGQRTCALQAELPEVLYRFQRRQAFRVRTIERSSPKARLRHPSMPDMMLSLRVLDVSIGGCALFLPHDVPPLQPGTRLAEVMIELDADTRFPAQLTLQHVTSILSHERGVRMGCEWAPLGGAADRALQRYIDHTQKQRRLMAKD